MKLRDFCSSYERLYLPEKMFPGRKAVEVSFDNSDQEVQWLVFKIAMMID